MRLDGIDHHPINESPSAAFARNLDNAIVAQRMTNAQVGVAAGMDSTQVSHYRTGKREPRIDQAARLARAVGYSLDDLIAPRESPASRAIEAAAKAARAASPRSSRTTAQRRRPNPATPRTPSGA